MTNQEAAGELQYAIDLIKQDGKDWLDERDIPILEAAISALRALDKIYAFIMQSEASETTDGVLEIFDALEAQDLQPNLQQTCNLASNDCISREAAIDAMKSISDSICEQQAIDALCELPSAQSEIVRCKDCENWIPGYITDNDDFIPPKCGKYQQMVGHSSDDYCSLAERRTE